MATYVNHSFIYEPFFLLDCTVILKVFFPLKWWYVGVMVIFIGSARCSSMQTSVSILSLGFGGIRSKDAFRSPTDKTDPAGLYFVLKNATYWECFLLVRFGGLSCCW